MKIDLKSGVPIYLQIVEQVKSAAMYGRYRSGDRLPPVRELALELRVNPNTVAKAYKALKEEGVVDSRPGGGNFIALREDESEAASAREESLRQDLKAVISKADNLGVPRKRLTEIFTETLK